MTKAYQVVSTNDDLSATGTAALIIVDDIYFSGKSMDEALARHGHAVGWAVLVLKTMAHEITGVFGADFPLATWVQFPWETKDKDLGKPEDAVTRLIEYVGDDPTRPGLEETPKRVLRFLEEVKARRDLDWTATTFDSTIEDLQAMGGIKFNSLCEHHMMPYFGTAAIGYIPNGKLIGLSKLPRILRSAAGGLTMQEHVTHFVAEAVKKATGSEDVAVVTTCSHTCMTVRGVKSEGASMISSAMLGKFKTAPALRLEFLALTGLS